MKSQNLNKKCIERIPLNLKNEVLKQLELQGWGSSVLVEDKRNYVINNFSKNDILISFNANAGDHILFDYNGHNARFTEIEDELSFSITEINLEVTINKSVNFEQDIEGKKINNSIINNIPRDIKSEICWQLKLQGWSYEENGWSPDRFCRETWETLEKNEVSISFHCDNTCNSVHGFEYTGP